MKRTPVGFAAGAKSLWKAVTEAHDLDEVQLVQLEEACRAKDRLDKLDGLLRGEVDVWARLVHNLRTEDYDLRIDAALSQANVTANLMKQLLASLRLPDEVTGKRPPKHGAARGAYIKGVVPSAVSPLDRMRAKASGES